MKPTILLLAFSALAFSSCTTAYKTGQTPDDVYFSPAPPQDEYVRTQKEDSRQYQSDDEYYDDRYLRMKVHNRSRWSNLDDWYYFGDRYSYSYYNNLNNPWNPNTYWNYYYNPYSSYYPYGSTVYILNPKAGAVYNKPRTFNLNTYNGNLLNNSSYTVPRGQKTSGSNYLYTQPRNTYNNTNNNNNNGSFLRNILSGSNSRSSSNNSSTNSNSSSNSSSSSSSSSGSSSGSSAPVRRF